MGSQEVARDDLVHRPARGPPGRSRRSPRRSPTGASTSPGIVGVAEDTDGALMLTTSDAAATREAFAGLGIAFEEHDPTSGREPTGLSIADIVAGRPA